MAVAREQLAMFCLPSPPMFFGVKTLDSFVFIDPFTFTCKVKALLMQLRNTSRIPGLCISRSVSFESPPRLHGMVDWEEHTRREPKSFGGRSAIPRILPV